MNRFLSLYFRLFAFAAAALGMAIISRAQTGLPDPTAGQPYSFQIVTNPPQAAGTTYSATGLPVGLSINSSTGVVSGTTQTVGVFKGTLSFTGNSTSGPYPFQITVDPAAGSPTISSSGSIIGTVGTPLSYTIVASNGPTSYNIAQLPPGLTASGGQIIGTPTTAGLFFTSVSANNGNGQGAILVLMFTISAAGPLPSITSAAFLSSAAGASFRGDLADATRRVVSTPGDDDHSVYSALGAALIAALAVDGEWPEGAFPAAGAASGGTAEPDEARALRWDELWAAHEAVRLRVHPLAGGRPSVRGTGAHGTR